MALSLGLNIARTPTQGSLADSATLGWRTQSLWDCRTSGLSGVPYGNGRAGNIRKAWAEILAALDWLHCTLRAFRYSKAAMLLPSPPLEERARERRPSFSTLQPNRLAWNLLESCSKPQDREPGRASSPQPSPPREERGNHLPIVRQMRIRCSPVALAQGVRLTDSSTVCHPHRS